MNQKQILAFLVMLLLLGLVGSVAPFMGVVVLIPGVYCIYTLRDPTKPEERKI